MKRAVRVKRLYQGAHAVMRQRMRTMQGHYVANQPALEGFNPQFTVGFGTAWLTGIDTADTTPPPAVGIGELTDETADVEGWMAAARQQTQSLFYYVGQAFPGKAGMLTQYGQHLYEQARKKHEQMRALLALALVSATRDQVALAAKGFGADKLAALGLLATDLTTSVTSQEQQKGENVDSTDDYQEIQNLAYSPGQAVSEAAKILFADDYGKLELFRLGDGPGPTTETHRLDLAVNETKTAEFATALVAPVQLRLHLVNAELDQKLYIGRSTTPDGPAAKTITLDKTNNNAVLPVADLGPDGQYLCVTNAGTVVTTVEMSVEPA